MSERKPRKEIRLDNLPPADAMRAAEQLLLRRHNLNEAGQPKAESLGELKEMLISAYQGSEPWAQARIAKFMKFLVGEDLVGLGQQVTAFDLPEALEFLQNCNVGQINKLTKQSIFTARQKLEFVMNGFETELSEECREVLNFFINYHVRSKAHVKEVITPNCELAARERGIPLFQELKTIVLKVTTSDGKAHLAAFHMRGDEEFSEELAAAKIRQNFKDPRAVIDASRDSKLGEELGLTVGRINPVSLEFAARRKNLHIRQFFSDTLDESIPDYAQEFFTNAGANTKGVSFIWEDFKDAFEQMVGERAEFKCIFVDKSKGRRSDRVFYKSPKISVMGDDRKFFNGYVEECVNKLIGVLRATLKELRREADMPPPKFDSSQSRLDEYFEDPEYYHEILAAASDSQYHTGGKTSEVVVVGNRMSLLADHISATASRERPDGNQAILYVPQVAVEYLREQKIEGARLIGSSTLKNQWRNSPYKERCEIENLVTSDYLDSAIRQISRNPSNVTGKAYEMFVNLRDRMGFKSGDVIVVASAELEYILKSVPLVKQKAVEGQPPQKNTKTCLELLEEAGLKFIFPVELAAQKTVDIAYKLANEQITRERDALRESQSAEHDLLEEPRRAVQR